MGNPEGRMVTVDLTDGSELGPILQKVMERLPGVELRYFPLEEDESQMTVFITSSVENEQWGFYIDEAEEILQDELESIGRTIVLRPCEEDWGTE